MEIKETKCQYFEENIKKHDYPIIGLIRTKDFKATNRCAIASVCGCDEEETYNITVINERFEKNFKKKHPNSYSTCLNIKYNTNYSNRKNGIDFLNVIRKYNDYYFIFVDIADKCIHNASFAQYDNHKDFVDNISKYRYKKTNTLYSKTEILPKSCYLMNDTYLIVEEMKEKGYLDFYRSCDYRLLDCYSYDPRYIY